MDSLSRFQPFALVLCQNNKTTLPANQGREGFVRLQALWFKDVLGVEKMIILCLGMDWQRIYVSVKFDVYEGNGAKRSSFLISMSVCSVAKHLKAAPGRKNSAAGIVMCAIGSGGRYRRSREVATC